jgi:RNA polymerase sigma-70 factor (ECF subfamily)
VPTGLSTAAFEKHFVALERPLYNVVLRTLWDPDDAREVVQEAFVRLWDMRRRVDTATVRPLVFRIALNLATSRKRRGRRPWWRWPRPNPSPAPEENVLQRERLDRLRGAVDQLPPGQRDVIMLCELGGLSYAEVADVLSIKVGTVGSRRHAALANLRRLMQEGTLDAR